MTKQAKTAKTPAKPAATKEPVLVEFVTQPLAKALHSRSVFVEKGSKANYHYNNDGSITIYSKGVKIHRTLGDADVEEGTAPDDYDAEEAAEKFLRKWFGTRGHVVLGRATHGARWKNKAKKAEEAARKAAAEAEAAATPVARKRQAKKGA